jgi:hypothetical protein
VPSVIAAPILELFAWKMVWLLALWVAVASVTVHGGLQQCPQKTVMADFNMTEVGRAFSSFHTIRNFVL